MILALGLWIGPAASAAPVNDAFAQARSITGSGSPLSISGGNVGATRETGEAAHARRTAVRSIWFRWAAPASGLVTFDTVGSSFDTVLACYRGSALTELVEMASNDDINYSAGNYQSRVSFNALAGTTYQIAVDGAGGASGSVRLKWNSAAALPDLIVWGPSANPSVREESFASTHCAVVEGLITAGTHRLLRFSSESRNRGASDVFLGSPSGNPLFEYAGCHGHYHLHGFMSYRLLSSSGQTVATGLKTGFCLLDSIRWDSGANATAKYHCGYQGIQKGWGDIYLSHLDGQWVVITGLPDGLYDLEMTVNPDRVVQESDYANNSVRIPVGIGAPPNDQFSAAQALSAGFTTVSSYNMTSSAETGEPDHAGSPAKRSVWFKWQPSANSLVTLDTKGSSFDTRLAVYTGSSVSALTRHASNDDISYPNNVQSRVSFNANSLITYTIAVDGYQGANGYIKLNRSSGALNLASSEAGPDPAGLPGGLVPILGANRLPLGEVKLTIRGEPGRAYLIEVSSDLRHWTPVATTLADASGMAYFLDNSSVFVPPPPGEKMPPEPEPSETARPLLFYRAALEKEKPGS